MKDNFIQDEKNDCHDETGAAHRHREEGLAYAMRLIAEFKAGLLPLTDGTTLRTFLSKLLHCDPMRISKKFVGANCIGKQVFRRRQADIDRLTPDEIARSRQELAEARAALRSAFAHAWGESARARCRRRRRRPRPF